MAGMRRHLRRDTGKVADMDLRRFPR